MKNSGSKTVRAEPCQSALAILGRILPGLVVCALWLAQAPNPAQAQEPTLQDGRATVYVYRPQSLAGMGAYFDVYAGTEIVCNLKENEYCVLKIAPGEVEVWSKFMTKGSVTLDVEAGREYYVRASVTKGFLLFWRPHYVEVLDRVGRSEIKACTPAAGGLQD